MRKHLASLLVALSLGLPYSALAENTQATTSAASSQSTAADKTGNNTGEAQEAAATPLSREQWLEKAKIAYLKGPCTAKLGSIAELKIPAGYLFVAKEGLPRFLEATHNMGSDKDLGVLLSPSDAVLFFDYDPVGYVKDDEKDSLDADKLMSSLQEGQEAANEQRKQRGWDAMKMQGWATQPHYDKVSNNLKWAYKLSSSRDEYKSHWINESIRLLGRGGVMNVTLVTDPTSFAAAEKETDEVLSANFTYVEGERYAEFKAGDKIAEYGLAALVVGGGMAVAAKTGLLAKFWKVIVAGVIGLGAIISKFFKKLAGKDVS